MHKIPITIARRLALKQSEDEGEPAMYTMTYGVGLILLAYAIQIPIVWWVAGGAVATLYLASLIVGAYYAAYADHTRRVER